ncbi:MAG: glycine cleavage system protein GcvH [Acidobacteria bacterium]|nr:MAG: glycine cleavage system protein GcvH [Acidobacteriota bacterium]RLE26336.1 MAG: glycine cleavage system protein GcvH [Acidobacteriota bacterium]
MSIPQDLRYTKSHEWVRIEGDSVVIGITHYAQDQLGEVVFVELPSVGDSVEEGEEMGTLESVKAVSEMLSPLSGEVIEVNEALEDSPDLVNKSPFGEGWLVKIKGSVDGLMDSQSYAALIEAEQH